MVWPFARPWQMVVLGLSVILVRDLTDCLYNPAMPPGVSHDAGRRTYREVLVSLHQ